ncbi:hypothetical protein DEM28_24625, partial [Enterobacter mori]
IVAALKQKYIFLEQLRSDMQLQKEAHQIYRRRYRNNDTKTTNDFTSFYQGILFKNLIALKIIFAIPLFIVLSFYLNPMIRYIFERIVMAVVVIIGVIVVVFTILYLSPL